MLILGGVILVSLAQVQPRLPPPRASRFELIPAPIFPVDYEQLRAEAVSASFLDGFRGFLGSARKRFERDSLASPVDVPYLIGGETIDAVPAIGALLRDGKPHCTATVVGRRAVLTAAHCVFGIKKERLKFVVGPNAALPTRTFGIIHVEPHPSYRAEDLDSPDLGLLTLGSAFDLGSPVRVAARDMTGELRGYFMTMIGYGYAGANSDGLFYGLGVKRRIDVKVALATITQKSYRFFPREGRTACRGDSGGPALFVHPTTGEFTLVGVTSYGKSLCDSYVQDVRIDFDLRGGFIKEYAQWIADETRGSERR